MSYDIDITKTPPAHEPERQYYYMAKAKDFVEKKSKEIGRPMTYFVKTFGCQMNARDSEKLVGILEQIGYVEGTDEHSDFIVYNTCTVRENANNKVYGRLGYLQNYKKKNPLMKIALCGCMMQEPEVVENIKKHYKFVDIVFGTHNIFKFAEILCNNIESGSQVIDIWKDTNQIVEDLPRAKAQAQAVHLNSGSRHAGRSATALRPICQKLASRRVAVVKIALSSAKRASPPRCCQRVSSRPMALLTPFR